ncbi:discoidin, CUB and LCCL domain-containing protein 2 isoform X1 [Hyla sarda]|uniref:discoidin, CUB and LCCL domain-containing protein 2 isoform X1 n=2 Tax=Hyla sarda TaxID=327740 RepID=UPI0024C35F5D|nr:discoidin, CUB and LCCL domain-containing protein 2 isoform X1 [Hyla sarda]
MDTGGMLSGRPPVLLLITGYVLSGLLRNTEAQNGDGCGYTFFGPESGTFTSKNYPNTYPNSTVCEWKIQMKPGERILLKFGDFDIEDVDSCHSSYLRIYDGFGASRTELGAKYCGLALKPEDMVESKSHEVTVLFMSGIHISGRGFLASYSTTNKTDLITCLEKASRFSEPEYRKYCPAGCLTPFGEISGTIPVGYRDSSLLCMAGIHAGVVSNALGGPLNVVISNGIAYYDTAQANNVTSKVGSLSSTLFTFKTSGCYGFLGMENGAIPDSQITASTVLEWTDNAGQVNIWKPERARLKKQGPAWAASYSDERQWLQIDLNKLTKVTGIITTGSTMSAYNYYVTSYRIEYSEDGLKWTVYRDPNVDRDKLFQANSDYFQEVRNNLIPPIVARFVKIRPTGWNQKIAMKVELLGCQFIPAPIPKLTAPPAFVPRAKHNPLPIDKTTSPPEIKNTTVTPDITKDVPLAAILVPALVMVCTSIVVLLVCAWHWRNRKKKTEGTYDLPYWDRAGWWKGMKQFLPAKSAEHEETPVRYSSCEVNRLRPREMTAMSAEYAQPLVGGAVGTLHQRSTFKPEEGKEGGYADLDSYNSPDTDIYHAYAEPLPTNGPEYATPIIMDMSAHPAGTMCLPSSSTFKGTASQAPVLVGAYNKLVSRTDSSSAQVLYDTPKVTPGTCAVEETVYQVPQPTASKDVPP